MSVCPVPGMPRGALPAHYSKQPRSRQASPPAYLPPCRPQSAASKPHRANTLPARRGLRPCKNTKNYPDCATIFRRLLLFSQKENKIAGSDAIN